MINNLDELLELVDTYHKWVTRTLKVLAALGLLYGGYKYGLNKGWDMGVEAGVNYMKNNPDSKTSSLPLSDGQPGRMWVPEV